MNTWGVALLGVVWSCTMFILGYFVAKPYWYERGHFDGLDAADRYVKLRARTQSGSAQRIGPTSRG